MLTIEMKVNGTIIGQIYAHNISDFMGNSDYKWHCYMTQVDGEPVLVGGTLAHQRKDGFLKLQALIVDAAMEAIENG